MLETLPDHLGERTRIHDLQDAANPSNGGFVLYWMRTAVRADENPALDVARWIAHRKGVPLLVYHAISEHYRFASDRHHTFMLQGARDVQRQFEDLEISYAFHLATEQDRHPHLKTLADQAGIVVTEDMPVDPPRRFLNALQRNTRATIIQVDTACVAPMKLIGKPHTRAFQFRSATKKVYAERLTRGWPALDVETQPYDLASLPFQPVDLQSANLSELVSQCSIDHAVGPVVDTVGGSEAGYQRWNAFKENKLSRYAKQRNNALLDGVSRMSPYLHYGMVSPFRLARETADYKNAGAEKFLDELLTWRELAYAFCFYREDHDQWSAIPDWARESLLKHTNDHRERTYSWEQLARAKTHDAFWNAAQESLLKQGELHNNVRMTWGKAILNWKNCPQEALRTIIDLNHRYALDGRDPASYGGILWCLGQFDRPFDPEQNVIGVVRPRPTSQHACRLDTETYFDKVTTPRFQPVPRVAVIGAGISGLFAARTLKDHGMDPVVFEKSRGVGGRMATRRADKDMGQLSFDHGAQYFTARNRRFIRYVDSWIEQGIVSKWPDPNRGDDQKIAVVENGKIKSLADSDDRYVAVPAMNSICKHLAEELEIQKQTRVASVEDTENGIELTDDTGKSLGIFDRVVVSAPAEQAAELLKHFPEVAKPVSKIQMNPCLAAMVAFEKPLTTEWVGAFLHGGFISWAARNHTKPNRNDSIEQLIIHAAPDWTDEHWEDDSAEVAEAILNEFWRVTGISPQTPTHLHAHGWKYAIPVDPPKCGYFPNKNAVVLACGDWASGSRVEGAFLSGMAVAGRILGSLHPVANQLTTQQTLF